MFQTFSRRVGTGLVFYGAAQDKSLYIPRCLTRYPVVNPAVHPIKISYKSWLLLSKSCLYFGSLYCKISNLVLTPRSYTKGIYFLHPERQVFLYLYVVVKGRVKGQPMRSRAFVIEIGAEPAFEGRAGVTANGTARRFAKKRGVCG